MPKYNIQEKDSIDVMNRRKFMITVGMSSTVAVAGCSGGDTGADTSSDGNDDADTSSGGDTGTDVDTSSPTATVESFYQVSYETEQDASVEESIDTIDPLVHSVSPIPDSIREAEGSNTESVSRSLDTISTEVADQDLDETTLNQEFGLSRIYDFSEDDIATIAEENAIVEGEASYDNGDNQQIKHITATEGGDWVIVI